MKKITKEALLKRLEKMHGVFGKEFVARVKDFDVNRIERIVNITEMMKITIDRNKMHLDLEDFKKFPKRVQKEIISELSAYDECNVSFEFGQWNITSSICIKSYYHKDHRFFGTFYYDDLVEKVKGLKKAREKYLDDFRKIDVPDSFWA